MRNSLYYHPPKLGRPIPNQFVVEKLNLHAEEIATASVVVHELLYGALRMPTESARRQFLLDYVAEIPLKIPVLNYDLKAARWHAEERARLSKIGKTPAFIDG